jgi:Uma2 family endonuclease
VSLTVTKPVTADELLAMPDDGWRYELVKGELIRMSPTGQEHGELTLNLSSPLHYFVKRNKLGVVCAAETGFILNHNPDTVRAPDTAFISRERFDKIGRTWKYWDEAPDLAVEVLSPSDTVKHVKDMVSDWLKSGSKTVWVVNPKLRTVTVYNSSSDIRILTEKDRLTGGDTVPGFEISVAEIFSELKDE